MNNKINSSEKNIYCEENIEVLMMQYLDTLSEKEKKAYHIAKSHLGSSFQLEKSNTFLQWKRENDSKQKS